MIIGIDAPVIYRNNGGAMVRKIRLLSPGPTMIPERVSLAMAQPLLHHRSPEFKPIFMEGRRCLQPVFGTKSEVLLLASSGTGAMEATVTNLFSPGDTVITVEAGKFGQRWRSLCKNFGITPVSIEVPWGQAVSVAQLRDAVTRAPQAKGILMQGCETSTGAYHPLEEIARWKQKEKPDLLLCVDGITTVGAMPVEMDTWGLDVLLTGSQKALMLPPGLAALALSAAAWKRVETEQRCRPFYFDLIRERKNQVEAQTSAWTPAISLIVGLVEAMKMLTEEGLPNVFARHAKLAHATREAGKGLGLKLVSPSCPSDSVSAFFVPDGIDGEALTKRLRDRHGFTFAGGQDQFKGKIIRIGHMGYFDAYDLIGGWAAVERALGEMGWKGARAGTSVERFLECLDERGGAR